jgi:hypothetical protein
MWIGKNGKLPLEQPRDLNILCLILVLNILIFEKYKLPQKLLINLTREITIWLRTLTGSRRGG